LSEKIVGTVVSLSETGGLVTDITTEQLMNAPRDESVSINVGGHKTIGIYPEDHGQPDATLLAVVSDELPLRIELTGISVSEMLGLNVGETVTVEW